MRRLNNDAHNLLQIHSWRRYLTPFPSQASTSPAALEEEGGFVMRFRVGFASGTDAVSRPQASGAAPTQLSISRIDPAFLSRHSCLSSPISAKTSSERPVTAYT